MKNINKNYYTYAYTLLLLFILFSCSAVNKPVIDTVSIRDKSMSFNFSIDTNDQWAVLYDSTAINLKDSLGNYLISVTGPGVDSVIFSEVDSWIDSMEAYLKKPVGVRLIAAADSAKMPTEYAIRDPRKKEWIILVNRNH